ncbi:hypothetical protein QCN29_14860 [Streptomyces sp. HNM0663]|uniref:Uncharacterized protein n=1 Tax=Streptomyces chengmaiensis TaxID=3040919 RepID=A0ABT6HP97_9ACTN|nr:hypothetical protein [Streptomyces chengmaiensis]MDH2390048.1 hypothetical protein [Streptomyces chengmaiensis]
MRDENAIGPHDGKHEHKKSPGLIARAKTKTLYKERPTVFAFGVMGVSVLSFLLGALLMGEIVFPPFMGLRR